MMAVVEAAEKFVEPWVSIARVMGRGEMER